MEYTKTDDRQLLRAYAEQRSHEAFATLAAKYADMVFRTALRRTRDRELAEDVTQAVFIVLARSAGTLRAKESIAGWLHQTAVFAAGNALRAEERRKRHERNAARIDLSETSDDLEIRDLAAIVEQELHRLPGMDRKLLILHFLEGIPIQQAADDLQISLEAARKRLSRALEKLRKRLARRGAMANAVMIGSSLAAIGATSSGATAVTIATTAVAGGTGGSAFALATDLIHMMRMLAMKKAAATLAVIGIVSGLGSVTIAQLTASPATKPSLAIRQPTPTTAPASQPASFLSDNLGTPIDWRPVVTGFDQSRAAIKTLNATIDAQLTAGSNTSPLKISWVFDGATELRDEFAFKARYPEHRRMLIMNGDTLEGSIQQQDQGRSFSNYWIYPGTKRPGHFFNSFTFFGNHGSRLPLAMEIERWRAVPSGEVKCFERLEAGSRIATLICINHANGATAVYVFDRDKNALIGHESRYQDSITQIMVDELREAEPGLWLPARYTQILEKTIRRVFTVSSMKINSPVDPAVFHTQFTPTSAIQDYRTRNMIWLEQEIELPDFTIETMNSLEGFAKEFKIGVLTTGTTRPAGTQPATTRSSTQGKPTEDLSRSKSSGNFSTTTDGDGASAVAVGWISRTLPAITSGAAWISAASFVAAIVFVFALLWNLFRRPAD